VATDDKATNDQVTGDQATGDGKPGVQARGGVPAARQPEPAEPEPEPAGLKPAEPGPVEPRPEPAEPRPGPVEPRPEPAELEPAERAQFEQLKSEVSALRAQVGAQPAKQRRPARGRWRTPAAALAIVLGCVLAPVSVLGVWGANEVSNTDRYVANVAPLIHDPAMQRAISAKITDQVTSRIDVQALVSQASSQLAGARLPRLSTLLQSFSGQIAGAVDSLVSSTVAKVVASPAAATAWTQANRLAHAGLVRVLSGNSGAGDSSLSLVNGQVVLNLGPLINQVKQDLVARGLTIASRIPAVNATFPLFAAPNLAKAQSGYRLVTTLKWVLPLLTLALLAGGVALARGRRRGLIGAALGLSASMLVLAIALAIARAIYLNSVQSNVLPSDAAAAAFDTLVRFVKQGLRVLLLVGLVVAAGAFLAGPSTAAVATRRGLANAIGWLRARGDRAGLRAGPAGAWTAAHIRPLRVGAVLLAVLVFIFWGQPTLAVVVWLVLALLLVLGVIELLASPNKAGPNEAGPNEAVPRQPGADAPTLTRK